MLKPAAREPQSLLSEEEILDLRRQVTDFYHSVEETKPLLAFARRIESLVRRRLAERLVNSHAMPGAEIPDTFPAGVAWGIREAARIVEED